MERKVLILVVMEDALAQRQTLNSAQKQES